MTPVFFLKRVCNGMGNSSSGGGGDSPSPPPPPEVKRTYFTGMAECGDKEVLVGVQMLPRDPSNDTAGISMAAICENADGVRRTVTDFTKPKTFGNDTRVLMQGEQMCPKGRYYGAGVGMADYDALGFGPTLRCGVATPIPARSEPNMSYVMRQFNAPPEPGKPAPSIVFTTNPNSGAAKQRFDDAVTVSKT